MSSGCISTRRRKPWSWRWTSRVGLGRATVRGNGAFPQPPAEPGVRVSTHRALHGLMPVGACYAAGAAHGAGMFAAR